ncbi:MAG: hypothetical protein GF329_14900 [Candidatus Lokiarchaeota archaeon]|nr:hypothetical protein [Candidatus Lokiarchaeota archaeon]
MNKKQTKKWEKFLNKRGTKTFIITIILFTVGISSYLIQKSLELGGWAIPTGIILVWILLWVTRIDEVMMGK